MQINVEVLEGLERKMTVKIPSDEIDQAVEKKLKALSSKVKMDGFRPGKVPPALIRQRFADSVRGEVLNEVLGSSYTAAIKQESLKPATLPKMHLVSNEIGKPIEYEAVFEVYPSIEIKSLSEVEVEGYKVDVLEKDVDEMVENLRKQSANWNEVDRAAKEGDRLELDFHSLIDGESFEGGSGKNVQLILGSKAAIPGFEEGLIGAKAGETKKLELRFPDDYQHQKIAGKDTVAEIVIHKIYEPELPALDEAFAKKLGVKEGTVEGLKNQVRETIEKEVDKMVKNRIKAQVLEQFLEMHPIDLPTTLIDQEIGKLQQQAMQYIPKEKKKDPTALPKEPFEAQAKKRVSLGMLFSEFVRVNNIKLDKKKVEQTLKDMCATYADPKAVLNWYRSNKEQMQMIESTVLEEQVLETLSTQVKLTEKEVPYTQFMAEQRKGVVPQA